MHAHNPAQVIRHTAIVLAGAASIGLTGAAGAYIMTQMTDLQQAQSAPPPAAEHRAPAAPVPARESEAPAVLLAAQHRSLPVAFRAPVKQPEEVVPQVFTVTPAAPAALAGTLRLGDTTYVGAQIAPSHTNTFALSVDTNLFSTLSGLLRSGPIREGLDAQPDLPGVTRLSTEFDGRAGVTLVFSDPALGEHAIQLNRNPAPAEHAESPETAPQPTAPPAPGTITV
ncbi:hypothetical protein [Nocardia sp. NPDC048505]|uniref:hypothetical protein n=1 Tax=unclassified Nocardia TaxID=2637762 RepID=UPI0033DBEBAF